MARIGGYTGYTWEFPNFRPTFPTKASASSFINCINPVWSKQRSREGDAAVQNSMEIYQFGMKLLGNIWSKILTLKGQMQLPWLLEFPFGKVISELSNGLFYPKNCSGFSKKGGSLGKSQSDKFDFLSIPSTTSCLPCFNLSKGCDQKCSGVFMVEHSFWTNVAWHDQTWPKRS